MKKQRYQREYYTSIQMKIPVDLRKIIEISDEIYSFTEVMDRIDLIKYVEIKESNIGRPRFEFEKLMKIILFAFMEEGNVSTRRIVKLCKTDVRYIWMLDGTKAPSHMTVDNFINNCLKKNINEIFADINAYIFEQENVDLDHIYIDGTKIEANANKYTWVWKKTCITNRNRSFEKITELIHEINEQDLLCHNVEIGTRSEYCIEYMEYILTEYKKITDIDESAFVHGKGKRKSQYQKHYEKLYKYLKDLKRYAMHIDICGDKRNSYSKTDHDATFMRIKTDYMGNDQLLPAYNMQLGVCDGYIAVVDAMQYASDSDCYIPLMQKFNGSYGFYPKYPVADAGYGSYNNYLFCESAGMEKFMKFSMFNKETSSPSYRDNPFRAVNFKRDENGTMICPNNKRFNHIGNRPVRGNKFGRTEEVYQCEDCTGCPLKDKCNKSQVNRKITLNRELTSFHQEVIDNLESIHGVLLRMNRSVQVEGAFGNIKWNRDYKRAVRRGLEAVVLEFSLVSIGFNLHKYHLNRIKREKSAA